MPKLNTDYIKVYRDGRIDMQISHHRTTAKDGKKEYDIFFVANGDSTTIVPLSNSYSPAFEKVIDGKKLFESVENQIKQKAGDSL